jgi:quercetin dioxygenase-like cupin family protein
MMNALPRLAAAVLLATLPSTTVMMAEATRKEVLVNESVRVVVLGLEPGDATPQHTHVSPHVSAALTAARLVDERPDGSEQEREMTEGALAYVPPGVSHTLKNGGSGPFRAVTIDLLKPQTGTRNRCAALLKDQKTDCSGKAAKGKLGDLVPQIETDQTTVSLLTLDPKTEHIFKGAATPPVVVALAGTEALALIEIKVAGGAVGKGEKPLKAGDAVSSATKVPLKIRNVGSAPARFLVVDFK